MNLEKHAGSTHHDSGLESCLLVWRGEAENSKQLVLISWCNRRTELFSTPLNYVKELPNKMEEKLIVNGSQTLR